MIFEYVVALVGEFDEGKNKGELVLRGHGKFVILKDGCALAGKPASEKVAVEIVKELDRVRFGRLFPGGEEAAWQHATRLQKESRLRSMEAAVAPLRAKYGDLPFPLVDSGDPCQDDPTRAAVFAEVDRGVLSAAIISSWAEAVTLNSAVAEDIWRRQVAVEPVRARLYGAAYAAWTEANTTLDASSRYEFVPLGDAPRRSDLAIPGVTQDAPTVAWSDEGLAAYRAALATFVAEEKARRAPKAAAREAELRQKIAEGWVPGEHRLSYGWFEYQSYGGHESDVLLDSGVTVRDPEQALLHPDVVARNPYRYNNEKKVCPLTDDEYEFCRSLVDTEKTDLLIAWLIAADARAKERAKEEEELRGVLDGPFRFAEILRRVDEGWIVTGVHDGGGIDCSGYVTFEPSFNSNVYGKPALVDTDGLVWKKSTYTPYESSWGRASPTTVHYLVAPPEAFVVLTQEEYESLPTTKIRRALQLEAQEGDDFLKNLSFASKTKSTYSLFLRVCELRKDKEIAVTAQQPKPVVTVAENLKCYYTPAAVVVPAAKEEPQGTGAPASADALKALAARFKK